MSSPASTTPEWFIRYHERGFKLYRYPLKQKGPSGREGKKWTENFAQHFTPDSNWGVALGTEIAPGKFLVDVDFDWPDGIKLAKRLLPQTDFGFGRKGKFISHAFYTTPTPVALRKFEDVDGQCLVELRGTKKDGTIGFQTMVPPSVHPSGEALEMRSDSEIAHVEDIEACVISYAIGCLLLRNLEHRELHHNERLALAGLLLKECRLPEERVMNIAREVASANGNDPRDAESAVRSTADALRRSTRVIGKTALAKALGERGADVVARIIEWTRGGETAGPNDIVMTGGALSAIVDRAEDALLAIDAPIYQRGGGLVRPVRVDSRVPTESDARHSRPRR